MGHLPFSSYQIRIFKSVLITFVLVLSAITALSLTRKPQEVHEGRAAISSPIQVPVTFTTNTVSFSADKFSLLINNRIFKSMGDIVERRATSDPGTPQHTTLEADWTENVTPMKLYMNFVSDGTYWWVSEIRTYDGKTPGNWLLYTQGGPYFKTLMNEEFVGNVHIRSDDGRGDLTLTNLRLSSFRTLPQFWSDLNLIPFYQTTVEIPQYSNYSITQAFYNRNRTLIPNQGDFVFQWRTTNPGIVRIQSQANVCLPGMVFPCPTNNFIETASINRGFTYLILDVVRKSTGLRVDGNVWNIVVKPPVPNSPSNAHITQTANSAENYVQLNVSWNDNSSDEGSFIIDYIVENYMKGTVQSRTNSAALPKIYCQQFDRLYEVRAAIYAENPNGISIPTFAITTIQVPKCQNITPQPSGTFKPGDANGDGKVDGIDFTIWLTNYGRVFVTAPGHKSGDFNNDGKVDGVDFTIWLTNYGR